MLIVGQAHYPLIEIDLGSSTLAASTANGEYLLSGGDVGAQDGRQIAAMKVAFFNCLAVSKNGGWIAAGSKGGDIVVWDAKTYKQIFVRREDGRINAVDFSPALTEQLLVATNFTTTIWDVGTREPLRMLPHESAVRAAKYSPQGNQFATATRGSVRVWDSSGGQMLADIKVEVTPLYNGGLLWSKTHLFVVSGNTIKEFEALTGSAILEWPVPDSNELSCIALPEHGEFIAYSTKSTITFWDTLTHTELDLIQHPEDIHSIAFSPDDQFLAFGEKSKKMSITSLSVSVTFFWITAYLSNFLLLT